MRADMFKVIVERPRWAASHAPAAKLKKDKNQDRKYVGLKRHALEVAPYTKHLSENLAPLKRYLGKQCGRLWNDVFSEICAQLDTCSTVKMHVRDHIEDLIMVRISVSQNDVWLGLGNWGCPSEPNRWWPDLYVDPFDGIIKETRVLCRSLGIERKHSHYGNSYNAGPYDDFRRLNDDSFLIRRKGLWFLGTLNRDPDMLDGHLRDDILNEAWQTHERWFVVSWKQLSKRELKLYNVSNDGDVQ